MGKLNNCEYQEIITSDVGYESIWLQERITGGNHLYGTAVQACPNSQLVQERRPMEILLHPLDRKN
jgi:hypothetical protein